jgi:hypothetical protein
MSRQTPFIERCFALKGAGFSRPFEVSDRVARGFADLGYEEFIVLPADKLLSLFTGKITPLKHEDLPHLFHIPDVDQLLLWLNQHGVDVESINSEDQRNWSVIYKSERGVGEESAPTILVALLNLLLKVCG